MNIAIREADPDFALVFITVSREHALEAFSVLADAYAVKPIERESIDAAFKRCRGVVIKNAHYIEVTSGRGNIEIPYIKIHHIENRGRAAMIHTLDGMFTPTPPWTSLSESAAAGSCSCARTGAGRYGTRILRM